MLSRGRPQPTSLRLVDILEANLSSMRQPPQVPVDLWAPRRRDMPYVSDELSRMFPQGFTAAIGDIGFDARIDLAERLRDAGLRPGAIRTVITDYRIRSRTGLDTDEVEATTNTRYRTGRLPSVQQIFRYPDHATYANAWSDVFHCVARTYATDAATTIEAFLEAWRLYRIMLDEASTGFDVTDAWMVSRLEIDGELEVLPCRQTDSTFVRPSGKDVRTPWRVRRDGVLFLRERVIIHLLAKDLIEHGVRADDVEPAWRDVRRAVRDRNRVRRNRF